MTWDRNDRGDQVLVVEDDASRYTFDLIETDRSSAAASVVMIVAGPDPCRYHRSWLSVREHVTGWSLSHDFEGHLHDNGIMQTLDKVGRPQSNDKIDRCYQTYDMLG